MKEIIFKNGMKAFLDDEDFEKFGGFNYHVMPHGNNFYARRGTYDPEIYAKFKKGHVGHFLMHREIMGITDPKISIDHIDGNGLNNQKSNLRICTHSQTMGNRNRNKNSNNKFKGVCFRKDKGNVFYASIGINGIRKHIGSYESEIEAALAYNVAASFAFREFARLNKIEV